MKLYNYTILITILMLIGCAISLSTYAQIDTIRLKDKRLNTSVLKPTLNQYLIYFQDPEKKTSLRFSLYP